ncbi:hypothetical protein HNP84_009693 [Thermocatellispora tengchongensis]|uniref:DUF742 domain-containing protein n=1 Tax=Thermocatellispora tengchongensis TaxID=1073253 RepID=A0A840PLV4_9ACTN|nr:DUF742 domain-containing protein [Thermocatellispora tengchongensis]MBB5139929.1 hypothetical protein [Thermocatellispora tengchongensis]
MSDRWLDDDAGPIVRPYTVTRGRTRPTGAQFDLIAIVTAVPGGGDTARLTPEHLRVLAACSSPVSVAEAASATGLALAVCRVLLGDLRDRGLVTVRPPATVAKLPQEGLLREVLQGLRAL